MSTDRDLRALGERFLKPPDDFNDQLVVTVHSDSSSAGKTVNTTVGFFLKSFHTMPMFCLFVPDE